MHNGYAQAEGVDNLDGVPGHGLPRLVRLAQVRGRPRRLRALHRDLPARTRKGVKITRGDAPLPEYGSPLHWDFDLGYRVR